VRATDAEAPEARWTRGRGDRPRAALERALLLALALAAPALCLAQETDSTGAPTTSTPASSMPATGGASAGGLPAAEVPGAGLPGLGLPTPGLIHGPMPAEYTNYGAAVGVGGTDNVNLSSTDPKAQGLAAANLFFDLMRTGTRLELSALGNFSDIDYLEHAYSNQVLGRFDGLADATLWPRHLKWLVRDDYGDTQVDVLQALTPRNLQRVNVFSTGPDLTLQPTLTSFVEMQGIYSRNNYQTSPFSGQTEVGSIEGGHQFSPSSSGSLVARVQQERFDNRNVNVDYQIREYYGHYKVKNARTALDVQGGVDQTNDTGSWKSSPMVRLSVSREISLFSRVSLAGGRTYTNATGTFANLAAAGGGGIPIGPGAQTTGSALRSYGNAGWDFSRLRTTIDVFGGWEHDAYDRGSHYDNTRTDLALRLGRKITPKLSANIMATVDRSRYGNQGFSNTYGTAGAGLVYHPGAWLVIYGRYDHQFRRFTGPTSGLGYDENRVFIMVGYYPHPTGTAVPGAGGMMGEGGAFGMP
jgi:hypothetical protein